MASVVRGIGKASARIAKTAGRVFEESMREMASPVVADVPEDGVLADTASSPSDDAAIARGENGATLPPIVVGTPSPSFEPRVIDTDRHLGASLRPSIVADGWTSGAFAVRAASSRGLSHQWYGSPRQDDYALALTRAGWLVAGVADGVSAAGQSHVASSEVLQYLAGWFAATNPQSVGEIDFQALLEMIRWDLVEKERKLCPDVELPGRDLATTITFAIVVPRGDGRAEVTVVGVGDSGCWVLEEGRYERKLGGKSDGEGGISDSTVAALPLLPDRVTPTAFILEPGQVLLLGTDGVGDPLGDGTGEVGAMLSDALLAPVLPSPLAFARVIDFSRETFDDDRTLVAVRLAGCASDPTPGRKGGEPAWEGGASAIAPVRAETTGGPESGGQAAGTTSVPDATAPEGADGTFGAEDGIEPS